MLDEMYCAICRTDALFEQPPCVDGHEGDCPEWVCTACGSAVLAGPTPRVPVAPRRRVAAA